MSEPIVSVVLPTYNEAQSLRVLVPRILEAFRQDGIGAEVIVVDDDSPDGTADVARELAETLPVRVLHRTDERGLATAVLAGFAMSSARVCVVMDADSSHPVSALPAMVRMIEQDKADVVVGSRHVAGGGSHNWPVFSQLKSKFAASLTFGITSMTDPTTGFMGIRRDLLQGLQLDPVGWKIVLEIVVKAAPVRVAEVPIVFSDRELGESKQSLGVFLEYMRHLSRLYAFRYPALVEFLKFCFVGLLGVAVDLGTVVLLKELLLLDTRLCAVGGFSTAVTTNYLLNRSWTFRGADRLPWLASYATFVGASLLGLSVRMLAVHALMVTAHMDEGYGYVLSNLIGIGLATMFNFVGAKFFAFDPRRLDEAGPDPVVRRPRASADDRLPRRGVWLLVACAAAYALATGVLQPSLTTDDEGVNVTMARNVMHSSDFLLHPSVVPLGHANWRSEDLPLLGNTPWHSALLAVGGEVAGLEGMAAVSFLAWLLTLCFTRRLVALVDRRASWFTLVLMAASPALLSQFRSIEFEPVLTAFCAAGLYVFVGAVQRNSAAWSVLGGALLGLGFLTKLWLVAPYVLAAAGFLAAHGLRRRAERGESSGMRRHVGFAGVGFTLTATAHLAVVAVAAPAELLPWIESVYLGIFSGHGVTGAKLSAVGPYARSPHPVWFYPALLYRDHHVLLPLALFGMPALARMARGAKSGMLALVFGGLLGVVILSIPAVKEPLYVLAVTPFLYVITGLSLSALVTDLDTYHGSNASTVKAVNILCMALVCASVLLFVLHPSHFGIGALALARHGLGLLMAVAVGVWWAGGRNLGPAVLALCAALWAAGIGFDRWQPAPAPHAQLARAIEPVLGDGRASEPAFVAPHSRILMGYLQRAGRDWTAQELAQARPDGQIHAWVLGPEELRQAARSGLLDALRGPPLGELPAPSGYRLFVRPP